MSEAPRNFPRRIEAAIFDFDETMIDLERQHTVAGERLCAAMGVNYYDIPEETRNASGKRVIDDVRDMRAFFNWTRSVEELLAERQRYFDDELARSEDLALMRGVAEVVRGLHRVGLLLAVASSAVRNSIEAVLRRFDLLPLFAVVVDGSEVERGKPDPQPFLVTAGRLGVDPAQCVVFEDSSLGVRAAKSAGMYCIAVRNPSAQVFQDLDVADAIVSSFEEVDVEWFSAASSQTPR